MKIVISIFAVILLASCGASENTEEAEQSEKVTETTELTETEEPEEVAISEQTDETEEESEKPAETPLEDAILEIYAHLNTVDKFEEEQFVEGERDMGVINYMDRANGRRAIEALDEVQYYVFPAEDGGQNQYTDTMLDYEGGHILQLGVDGILENAIDDVDERIGEYIEFINNN